ncbi:kanadaptin isoform X2 [Ambystoma mexicanum]|uniref:kanadaptin isoform X2 n=1 Tax=Ambystoma mexicanum TaxID=8296 RepID=UPI0037E79E0E
MAALETGIQGNINVVETAEQLQEQSPGTQILKGLPLPVEEEKQCNTSDERRRTREPETVFAEEKAGGCEQHTSSTAGVEAFQREGVILAGQSEELVIHQKVAAGPHQPSNSRHEGSNHYQTGSTSRQQEVAVHGERLTCQNAAAVTSSEGTCGKGVVSVSQSNRTCDDNEGEVSANRSEGPSCQSERSDGKVKQDTESNAAGGITTTGSSDRTSREGPLVRQKSAGRPFVLPKTAPPIPYHEPPWAAIPPVGFDYHLETLKNGVILSSLDLTGQTWFVFGRLPGCDVSLEHPSASRYHAVLQYRGSAGTEAQQDRGFYVYDLGSTHGTFVNKQKIPPKTYCRLRVGHVLKIGGSTRLFILQGPVEDQESESELSVTQLLEARRQKQRLHEKMLGDDLDADPPEDETEKPKPESGRSNDVGCSWGMGDDALEEEEQEEAAEENPIIMEYQEEREAYYVKDPKKALQGFLDREGEELECEYDDQGHNTWLCRIKLPVNDSLGKQLIAEAVVSGKKKEALAQCSLEACRMLDMRGLLRQEAVSRKRRCKNWEEDDFYDSDDDIFLDRTGAVEKKRIDRMKKAGRIEEKTETYDSLVSKLDVVKYELSEIAEKLKTSRTGQSEATAQDSLDAFMKEIRSGDALDTVTRKKLNLQSLQLKKEQRRLEVLIKIVKPTALPELKPQDNTGKPKKLSLPLFGAMKGGKKFKLKTGAIGNLPPQRTNLPVSLFDMKGGGSEPEEEEEEDEVEEERDAQEIAGRIQNSEMDLEAKQDLEQRHSPCPRSTNMSVCQNATSESNSKQCEPKVMPVRKKKMHGPSRPPRNILSTTYPEDDPDYCVWTPPAGQSGDGKTHLNEKYGY